MKKPLKLLLRALIGCFGFACVSATALLAGTQAPTIVIPVTNYNFGQLSETEPLSHDFIVKNDGGTVLRISDVRPS